MLRGKLFALLHAVVFSSDYSISQTVPVAGSMRDLLSTRVPLRFVDGNFAQDDK